MLKQSFLVITAAIFLILFDGAVGNGDGNRNIGGGWVPHGHTGHKGWVGRGGGRRAARPSDDSGLTSVGQRASWDDTDERRCVCTTTATIVKSCPHQSARCSSLGTPAVGACFTVLGYRRGYFQIDYSLSANVRKLDLHEN